MRDVVDFVSCKDTGANSMFDPFVNVERTLCKYVIGTEHNVNYANKT